MNVCRPLIEAAQIDRFGFDVELVYLAYLAHLRLREVPVRWDHDPASKVSVARDSFRMFNEVRRIRREVDRGIYSEAISAARTAAMVEVKQGLTASPYRSAEA
jgi:dolichyl-phosphate beta-glucosyltransferase